MRSSTISNTSHHYCVIIVFVINCVHNYVIIVIVHNHNYVRNCVKLRKFAVFAIQHCISVTFMILKDIRMDFGRSRYIGHARAVGIQQREKWETVIVICMEITERSYDLSFICEMTIFLLIIHCCFPTQSVICIRYRETYEWGSAEIDVSVSGWSLELFRVRSERLKSIWIINPSTDHIFLFQASENWR